MPFFRNSISTLVSKYLFSKVWLETLGLVLQVLGIQEVLGMPLGMIYLSQT